MMSSMRRLALLTILAAAPGGSALAQSQDPLAPRFTTTPAPLYVAPSSTQVEINYAIADWRRLRASDGYAFADYARFLNNNPDWPDDNRLRGVAEKQMRPGEYGPTVLAFFRTERPRTGNGRARYAEALAAAGRSAEATAMAREAWASGDLSTADASTLGARWYMDQNIYVHQLGTYAGTPVTNGVPANGATSIISSGWTSSTLNAGDVVSFVSTSTPVNGINPQSFSSTGEPMQFVITATTADSGGAMTFPIAPAIYATGNLQNVTSLPATSTAIYVFNTAAASLSTITGKVSPQNLVVHKDFGTLAMVDMPLPGGTDRAYRAASKKSGKSLRVIRDYVATSDQWIQRLDVLYGVAVLRQELGCRVGG